MDGSGETRLVVQRYNPTRDRQPWLQEYRLPYTNDMTVLDALNQIKDHVDPTLTFRWSCRMGVCGSCGANVNGTPVLTCGTFIKSLKLPIRVGPLSNFPIIRDLVVDIDDFLEKLSHVKPWIIRKGLDPEDKELLQTPNEMDVYHQSSMCINCMLCYAACPVYGLDKNFLGPAASALAYRYVMDSRDQAKNERLSLVNSEENGIWSCTLVGECTVVCPKKVDPMFTIQRLKIMNAIEAAKTLKIIPTIEMK